MTKPAKIQKNARKGRKMPPEDKYPGGGTPIHYLYGYVPPKGVVILMLLV